MPNPPGCDSPDPPSVYVNDAGEHVCHCIVCARCKHHTGNANQGHYWLWCSVTKTESKKWHFCCPGNCELQVEESGNA